MNSYNISFLFTFFILSLPINELPVSDDEKKNVALYRQPVTYTLKVEVVDWVSGNELPNAQITVVGFNNLKATTNENGVFIFENLEAGTYTIKVQHVGYKPWKNRIEIQRDKEIKIKLKPQITSAI